MRIERLRCEHVDTPLAVHRARPRLSWIATERQRTWRVLASSRPQVETGDLWDSGTRQGDENLVIYAGKPLFSRQQIWWKVCCNGTWSAAVRFEMGLLSRGDWSAKWIESPDSSCRAPEFTKHFHLPRRPGCARAYICGLGYYTLTINGKEVGDHVLDPAQTDYDRRALYVAYNVSEYLSDGGNIISILLGCGFYAQDRVWGGMSYGRPKLIFQLHFDNHPPIVSDASWETRGSSILENNVYAGETKDLFRSPLLAPKGVPSIEVPWPTRSLEPQLMPPIRRTATLDPVAIKRINDVYIFDFGQNFAGWTKLTVRDAPGGAPIRMRSAEDVHPDGSLDTASTGVFATKVEQIDTYVPRGGGTETYEPRFTYHGFRYVEVSGLKQEPTPETLKGIVAHSDLERIGTFECSDPMLNRIYEMAIWTLRSNLHGIPTDCPAREKCGWLGDAHISCEFALNTFDIAPLYDKYLHDIKTSWRGGRPGDVAPGKRGTEPNGHLDWGLAVVFLPWHMWLYRGDDAILLDHYESMRQFMVSAMETAKDGIFANGYGDWCPPGSVEPTLTPPALTTTAWLAHAARVMTMVANRSGRADDAAYFEEVAKRSLAAFNRVFFTQDPYGSQCGDAMALALDLCPRDRMERVAAALKHDVVDVHKVHHTTGIFGSRFLHAMLARHGHGDVTLALLRQTTYPSIGDLLRRGATTFWECWGEAELDKKWGARSKNHPMQAALVAWFYQGLGGINPDPQQPGFKHVIIRPDFLALDHVKVRHDSRFGPISNEWRRIAGAIEMTVTLPANVSATVHLPSRPPMELAGGTHRLEV
jgi:alpha-L-rhamnosidase